MINSVKKASIVLFLLFGTFFCGVVAEETERVIVYEPYLSGSHVMVTGQLPSGCGEQLVTIQIIKPSGTIGGLSDICYLGETTSKEDGSFEHSVSISNLRHSLTDDGTYAVYAGTENALPSQLTQRDDGKYVQSFTISYAEKIYNVKAYGAVGNDGAISTDDSGVQAAFLAASGGGTVYFPKGHYVLTETINLPDNVNIVGEKDVKIEMRQSEKPLFSISDGKNILIDGLAFFGNGNSVCVFDNAENVKIKNTTVEDLNLIAPFDSESSIKQVVLDGNVLNGSRSYGIALINADGAKITANTVTGYTTAIEIKNAYNTFVKGNCLCNGGIAVYNGSLSIDSNAIDGAKNGILLSGVASVDANNNNIYNIEGKGIYICGASKNVMLRSNNLRSAIDGNVFLEIADTERVSAVNNAFLYAIGAGESVGLGNGRVILDNVKGITFSGNYLNNTGVSGTVGGVTKVSQNNILLENTITSEFVALSLTGTGAAVTIDVSGNSMTRNVITDGITADGIQLSIPGGANMANVSNNSVRGFDIGMFLSTAEHNAALPIYKVEKNILSDSTVGIITETGNFAVVRLEKNLNEVMEYLDLSQLDVKAQNGTIMFSNTPEEAESVGEMYIDDQWYSFGSLGKPKKLELVVNEGKIEASYSAFDLSQSTVMILSVYDEAGAMLSATCIEDKVDGSMYNTMSIPTNGHMAKVFVWEFPDNKPVYYCKTIFLN